MNYKESPQNTQNTQTPRRGEPNNKKNKRVPSPRASVYSVCSVG